MTAFLPVLLALALLQTGPGRADRRQARFTPRDLGRDVHLRFLGLSLIGLRRAPQQRLDLPLQLSLALHHEPVAHRLVAAGVGLHLRAVDGHRTEPELAPA